MTLDSSGMEMEKNLASANICSTFSFTYQLDNFCITIKMYSPDPDSGAEEQRYQHLLVTLDVGAWPGMGGNLGAGADKSASKTKS